MTRARYLGRLRLPLISLVVSALALLMTQYGWMARLETALGDLYASAEPVAPSGRTVLVVIDKSVVEATGRYPVDRTMLASALDRLGAGGASRIYIDILMNTIEGPEVDLAMENALGALGPQRVSLPISTVPTSDGGVIRMRPHERFARHARLAPVEPLFDADRRARRLGGDLAGVGAAASDWLALGDGARRSAPLPIDYSINLGAIARYTLKDVADGKTPAEAFRGKQVVIGVTITNPMSVVNVPVYERLSRVETVALAAETLLVGKMPRALSLAERWGLVFATALALCLLLQAAGGLLSFLLVAGGSAAWLWGVGSLLDLAGVSLPITAVPVAALLVWQVLKLRDSRLARFLSKRYTNIVGVGQNALVLAVDVIGDPAFVVTADGAIVGANEAFLHLVQGADPDGGAAGMLSVARIFPGHAEALVGPQTGHSTRHVALTMPFRDQGERHFDATLRAISTVTGEVAIVSMKDVTDLRHREAELTHLAFGDALTGLANRVAFMARLSKLEQDAYRHPFAVHLIDLDGFKKVNDTLGHHAGDVLLAGVGRRLKGLVRPDDMVARLGGDEFAIIQSGADAEGASRLAARVIDMVSRPFDIEGAPARVGASIGIALWPEHHGDAIEALKLADAAMYVAKRHKPAFAIHTPEGARLVA